MKVLFAVNNENISESITKKYQQEYKEIISAKNVYYFNAIVKELQRDKTYDRIVISEDLQPFSNNNYEQIDKFIFEKLDSISDEATHQNGNDIPIILICADRREKSDALLVKLFGIGVYNALIGKDRSITEVCKLINHPRSKKEAKMYYHVDSEDVDYKAENEGDVSEVEIQNILNHYKKLGRNEEKYVESFEHIASQYTDPQLRLIAKFLPLNVKAVLEANSPKYQEVVSFGTATTSRPKYNDYAKNNQPKREPKKEESNLEIIQKNLSKNRITEPVIIPSSISTDKIKKVKPVELPKAEKIEKEEAPNIANLDSAFEDIVPTAKSEVEPIRKVTVEPTVELEAESVQPKRRGRPRKIQTEEPVTNVVKRGRGRPKKQVEEPVQEVAQSEEIEPPELPMPEEETSPLNLFELGEEDETPKATTSSDDDMILPGLDSDFLFEQEAESPIGKNTAMNETPQKVEKIESFEEPTTPVTPIAPTTNNSYNSMNTASMLTKDKKVVAFVGTSKNGTSFLVNNTAELLSQKGINVAILDLTRNKNAYYIYTENEENLRNVAYSCIENLKIGNAQGIQVHKNLTVYTTLPGDTQAESDYTNILATLTKNYSLVILDCDFETDYNYFAQVQEIYLVQSLDILTIQPLTAFLRNLKAKNMLNPEKIRIVLNKMVNLKSVNEKTIIGGIAYYNDPAMSFMTELFNKDTVNYCTIPFEEQTYAKYLDGIINCKITLNGYSKNFIASLNVLGDMVYPLINNNARNNSYSSYNPNNSFSPSMNNTLNRMKNNY